MMCLVIRLRGHGAINDETGDSALHFAVMNGNLNGNIPAIELFTARCRPGSTRWDEKDTH